MCALPLVFDQPETPISWTGIPLHLLSLALADVIPSLNMPLLILTENAPQAQRLFDELGFYLPSNVFSRVLLLPDYETLPYDHFSPHPDIIAARLSTLYRTCTETNSVLILPLSSALLRMPPPSYLLGQRFDLRRGQRIAPQKLQAQLVAAGYQPVSQVFTAGEFTIRGSLIDLFPMGTDSPFRIEFDDDEIASLRTFDPESQRSLSPLDQINLLPAREYPFDDAAISHFREQWRVRFSGNPMRANAYNKVSQGHSFGGIEYYLPLFFEQTVSLWDYLAKKAICLYPAQLNAIGQQYWNEINERYHRYSADIERPLLSPEEIFIPIHELNQILQQFTVFTYGEKAELTPHENFALQLPDLKVIPKDQKPYDHLVKFINQNPEERILFCSESPGRRQMLHATLQRLNINVTPCQSWQEFLQSNLPLGLIEAPLLQGFWIKNKCIVITENDLYGMQVVQSRRQKAKTSDPDTILRSLAELHVGAAVVHRDHGVGRFAGLEIIPVFEQPTEFVVLLYADDAKLYVPVTDLQLISRYLGDPQHAPLHRLGSEQWQKQKQQAKAKIRDVAAQLLEVYAKRNLETTIPCQPADLNFAAFCQKFPFEETPDQAKAIEDVIHDLTQPRVMDRLICGDVGFGKTEVAMRAAFLACQSNKQVVVLVPTTLLAQQHYETFSDRFADYPITIELLSRFKNQKESSAVIAQTQEGKVDILIGTHKLLQSNIHFKRLGLIVIDEEHRFGVLQKERLKKLRTHVDVLTLTATPIPRTLNMAMNGLRDLSLITTPPPGRLAIRTFMLEKNKIMLREAILRELLRGGQVFYVYNEVATIERVSQEVSTLVPEAKVRFAHGQMRERELERIMSDFYHQRFNVLVCTTIIETGIDIPTANTIIIDRADRFGLAQLHQLRGRVGRSHHQAYAYLILPHHKSLTADAKKRLEAFASLQDLGVGFMLATHDLEIRGAGELLGEEQSGAIQSIGLNLYLDLLNKTIDHLRKGIVLSDEIELEDNLQIELRIPALLPDDYIDDVHIRLLLYKRLTSINNQHDLDEFKVELIDRFGLLPQPTENLLILQELKLLALPLGIVSLKQPKTNQLTIRFNTNPNINVNVLLRSIQSQPERYQFDGATRVKLLLDEKENILLSCIEFLSSLKPEQSKSIE